MIPVHSALVSSWQNLQAQTRLTREQQLIRTLGFRSRFGVQIAFVVPEIPIGSRRRDLLTYVAIMMGNLMEK